MSASIGLALAQDQALVDAARREGQLNVIALAHDWCAYGAVIDGFKAKYPGITVNELNPDARSGDEVKEIEASKDSKNPQAPDVIDVALPFGPAAKADGLLMPYKVSTWNSIPDSVKDADGAWYGDYYGVLSFVLNKNLVKTAPADWTDLLGADFRNSVALPGDPRTSNQAVQAVYAAGLSEGAAAGEAAGKAGLNFFKELDAKGNFVSVIGSAATVAHGRTPILITWDYNALAGRDMLNGNPPVEVIVPRTGVIASAFVQAISAFAPHPNAAKLWMEYLYSDEGQLGWLKGYCHPIRFSDLAKNGKVPQEMLNKLPPAESYAAVLFPTLDEQAAAKEAIIKNWDSIVGLNVQ